MIEAMVIFTFQRARGIYHVEAFEHYECKLIEFHAICSEELRRAFHEHGQDLASHAISRDKAELASAADKVLDTRIKSGDDPFLA